MRGGSPWLREHDDDGDEQQDTAGPEQAHVRRPGRPDCAELTRDRDERKGGTAEEQLAPRERLTARHPEGGGQGGSPDPFGALGHA